MARRGAKRLNAAEIRAFIEDELRPAVREDGGDVSFARLAGRTVTVRLGHLCTRCPSAPGMVKHFIEARLRRRFADDLCVEAVLDRPYFWK